MMKKIYFIFPSLPPSSSSSLSGVHFCSNKRSEKGIYLLLKIYNTIFKKRYFQFFSLTLGILAPWPVSNPRPLLLLLTSGPPGRSITQDFNHQHPFLENDYIFILNLSNNQSSIKLNKIKLHSIWSFRVIMKDCLFTEQLKAIKIAKQHLSVNHRISKVQ